MQATFKRASSASYKRRKRGRRRRRRRRTTTTTTTTRTRTRTRTRIMTGICRTRRILFEVVVILRVKCAFVFF